jgi:hypothetical protein
MPFQTHGPQPLSVRVTLRFTAEERARLVAVAEAAGVTLSDLIRRRALGKPIVPSVDLAMIRELRRVGGLLKHVHNDSGGAYSETTARVLSDIRAYIEQLSHDRQEG